MAVLLDVTSFAMILTGSFGNTVDLDDLLNLRDGSNSPLLIYNCVNRIATLLDEDSTRELETIFSKYYHLLHWQRFTLIRQKLNGF